MSPLKTKVNEDEVLTLLKRSFGNKITSVAFIKGGETSQAFSFKSGDRELVIRINSKTYSFEKDKFAYEHFATSSIPIPRLLKIDKFNEKYSYAISEKASGRDLDNFDDETHKKLLPQLISVLDSIHEAKIDPTGKFGYWNEDGNAKFESWKAFILDYEDEVYSNWDNLYRKTILEKDVVDQAIKMISGLVHFLPEERFLVHGDYGFNNVVSDGNKITGVLDWGESKYGDFLYDVAWLEFFSSSIKYGDIFKEHYASVGTEIQNYDERLLCYQLHLGIGSLGFFALSEQKHHYIFQKNKLLSLLKLS